MSASYVKIAVRLRPPNPPSPLVIITASKDQHIITIKDPKSEEERKFDFYRIFTPQQSQEDLFETICRPLVDFVLEGNNSCCLAYGQTGSGKHYTLFGEDEYTHESRGVVMRALEAILEETKRQAGAKDSIVTVSFYELCGDRIRDLGLGLETDQRIRATFPEQSLDIMEETEQKEVKVMGLSALAVKNVPELLMLLRSGWEMRRDEELKSGAYSTHSHTFVTISLTQIDRLMGGEATTSVLHFVQLASSDRPSNSTSHSDILFVHNSLTALGKVIGALGTDDVPYRDSKLTRLLSSSLRDRNITALVIAVNPAPIYYEESLSAFEFAERCLETPNQASKSELSSDYLTAAHQGFRIKVLQNELIECKKRLLTTTQQHDKQLQVLKEMLGIRVDIHNLIQSQAGSKERVWLNNQKEAIQRTDVLQKRNLDLERQCEDNKSLFEKIRDLEEVNQEKHIREMLELRDELQNLQEDLASLQQRAAHKSRSQLNTRTDELKQMLTHSHLLIEEKAALMDKMPATMKATVSEDGKAQKAIGKAEVEKLYSDRLADQRNTHESRLRMAQEQAVQLVGVKKAELVKLQAELDAFRGKKKAEIGEIKGEIVRLYDLLQAQKKLLSRIEAGDYNQHLRKVMYPKSLLPEEPTNFTHPYLFKALSRRPETSKHPIKQLQAALRPQSHAGSLNPALAKSLPDASLTSEGNLEQKRYCMTANLDMLRFEDAKKVAKSLQEFYMENHKRVQQVSTRSKELITAKEKLTGQLSIARQELERYKAMYTHEVKKRFVRIRQDDKLVIESQKRLLEKEIGPGTTRCPSRDQITRPSTSVRPKTTAARAKPRLMDVA